MLIHLHFGGNRVGVEVPEESCASLADLEQLTSKAASDEFNLVPWEFAMFTEDGDELTDAGQICALSSGDTLFLRVLSGNDWMARRQAFDSWFVPKVCRPLSDAIARGDSAAVQRVLDEGHNVSLPMNYDGNAHPSKMVAVQTPLYLAMELRSVAIVEQLLRAGADPNLGYEEVDFDVFDERLAESVVGMMYAALASPSAGNGERRPHPPMPEVLRGEFTPHQWSELPEPDAARIAAYYAELSAVPEDTMSFDYATLRQFYPSLFSTTSITPLWEACAGCPSAYATKVLLKAGADPDLGSAAGSPLMALMRRSVEQADERTDIIATARLLTGAGAVVTRSILNTAEDGPFVELFTYLRGVAAAEGTA